MSIWLAAVALGLAAALLPAPVTPLPGTVLAVENRAGPDGWMMRWRLVLALLAAVAVYVFVGGAVGAVLAAPTGAVCWLVIGRVEPTEVRREREAAKAELPALVRLLSVALSSGAAPAEALVAVAAALPGPAAARLLPAASRLHLGADPEKTWRTLVDDPALAPLGRALARAQATGAPVATTVERLADDLTRNARAEVEDRARAVGVKAAVPLGICLLPAFLLLGVVPVVGGLLANLGI
ncbi:type II secretion system F family protein [Nocardioides sp. KC13]|uniref:Type II secretion system F family protein n=1 Tax=Nocardioides turkmenicus TaxID=2711220 RepID=A0A6M1QVC7_9ACTN|nr:type II secretion system F family protein [Nocardioides sp. KC13]NGN91766.1 type II secretion system F family protein [Nocardioides sp. KC13]